MTPQEEQNSIINLLIQNEEALSRLYRAYGNIPDLKDLWVVMFLEEKEHANWLRTLLTKVEAGGVCFPEGRFNLGALQTIRQNIEEHISEASRQDAVKALTISIKTEKSFLEGNLFVTLEGDTPELKQILAMLADSTKKHLLRLEKIREQYTGA